MICPWRKRGDIEKPWPTKTIAYANFMECYKGECPFYEPEKTDDLGNKICERCKRTDREETK